MNFTSIVNGKNHIEVQVFLILFLVGKNYFDLWVSFSFPLLKEQDIFYLILFSINNLVIARAFGLVFNSISIVYTAKVLVPKKLRKKTTTNTEYDSPNHMTYILPIVGFGSCWFTYARIVLF